MIKLTTGEHPPVQENVGLEENISSCQYLFPPVSLSCFTRLEFQNVTLCEISTRSVSCFSGCYILRENSLAIIYNGVSHRRSLKH